MPAVHPFGWRSEAVVNPSRPVRDCVAFVGRPRRSRTGYGAGGGVQEARKAQNMFRGGRRSVSTLYFRSLPEVYVQ